MARFENLPKLSELMAQGMTEKQARQAYNRAYQKAIREARRQAKAQQSTPPEPTPRPLPPKAKSTPKPSDMVTVNLQLQHFRNGKSYGPGEATIPKDLASEFLNTEQHSSKMEEKFRGTKGCIIGPKVRNANKVYQVPIETFDDTLVSEQAPLADRIKSPGGTGNQNQGGGLF